MSKFVTYILYTSILPGENNLINGNLYAFSIVVQFFLTLDSEQGSKETFFASKNLNYGMLIFKCQKFYSDKLHR